jgi:Rhodanese-related sulfurtransferase
MNSGCISQAISKQPTAPPAGYRSVCYDGSSYIAVGTGGRIDQLKSDKTVTKLSGATTACLNSVSSSNDMDVIVGDKGVILFSKNGGNFKPAKSGIKKTLNCVTAFQGTFWAGGADGSLLRSSDGEHWEQVNSGIKNSILSISANDKMCMAVTREGQILMSADGSKWNITDYNVLYKGYSELFWFKSIRACGNAFVIVGEYQNQPGKPAVLTSDTGEVWQETIFNKINDKPGPESFPLTVNAVTVDWDQLVAACSGGKLLTVTECSECNKLDDLGSQNINDLASANGFLVLVGDNFWFDVRKSDAFRQYAIRAEQALKDYNKGAYIVDVRTDEEYSQKHIKGALHIPVDNVEAQLEKEIPDKTSEVIFYCAKGVRAQKALEKALLLGYQRVYNLGGIGDWPYATEAGISTGKQ